MKGDLMANSHNELGWAQELSERFAAHTAHTFILHLNVSDYVRGKKGYVGMKTYLTGQLLKGWQLVIFYDRAQGIGFLNKEMESDFLKIINTITASPLKVLPKEPEAALPLLEKVLRLSPAEASKILGREIKQNFATLIIGFAETIFPDGQITSQSVTDRCNIITLAQWARRSQIEKSGNLVLLMTNNLNQISPSLRSPESNIESIKVPYPDFNQRKKFLEQLPEMMKEPGREIELKFDDSIDAMAAASAGLTRTSLRDLACQAIFLKRPMNVDFIWEQKAQILEQMSGGLLEIIRPDNGFDVIGGLQCVKDKFKKVAKAIREGNILEVPQGELMVGPPGTGKSVLAEALAFELGFSMVKIRNLRNMWHGESENRQELVFGLIEALAPVVVFEDEIDQQEQARGTIFHGDSGVTARMTASKMAFMADVAHRGRILWIAATNRPDLMDQAMLRPGRYDDIIPCFPPDVDERSQIFRAIFLKMTRQADKIGKKVEFTSNEESLKELTAAMDANFTGAEIELICHRAVTFASERGSNGDGVTKVEACDLKTAYDDFIPSRDEDEYNHMIDLALLMVNSARMIPERYRERAKKIKSKARHTSISD